MTTKPLSSIEPLLTIQDAAAILKTCTKTVRRRIAQGDIAVVRNRRLIRIRHEDFERFLVRHRHG